MFQLPVSPGEFSHSDSSSHAMSLGLSQYRAGMCGGHDNLPISDNNVSTTNDALEAGDWEVPESEAELDVSVTKKYLMVAKIFQLQSQLVQPSSP